MSDTAEALLQSTTRDIEAAAGVFDAVQKGIPNHYYFSTDAGYEGAITEYEPKLQVAEQQSLTAAGDTAQQLRGLLAQLGTDGPTLPPEHEARAAHLRDLVKDEVTGLSWSDTARQYLYWHYASLRLSAECAQPQPPSWADTQDARQDAQAHLRTLAVRLTPETITKLRAHHRRAHEGAEASAVGRGSETVTGALPLPERAGCDLVGVFVGARFHSPRPLA